MVLIKNMFIVFFMLLYSCSTPPPPPLTIKYIPFDSVDYGKKDPNDVTIYKKRLDVGTPFIEIGTMIVNGDGEFDIKKEASKYGADGVIKDGKNYIFILIPDNHKTNNEVNNEESSI